MSFEEVLNKKHAAMKAAEEAERKSLEEQDKDRVLQGREILKFEAEQYQQTLVAIQKILEKEPGYQSMLHTLHDAKMMSALVYIGSRWTRRVPIYQGLWKKHQAGYKSIPTGYRIKRESPDIHFFIENSEDIVYRTHYSSVHSPGVDWSEVEIHQRRPANGSRYSYDETELRQITDNIVSHGSKIIMEEDGTNRYSPDGHHYLEILVGSDSQAATIFCAEINNERLGLDQWLEKLSEYLYKHEPQDLGFIPKSPSYDTPSVS